MLELSAVFGHSKAGTAARLRSRRRRPQRNQGTVHYLNLPFRVERADHKIRRNFTREGFNICIVRRSTTILDIIRSNSQATGGQDLQVDFLPHGMKAGKCLIKDCVYQITCLPCELYNVESTIRPLHERIREHIANGRGSTIHDRLTACGVALH